MPHEISQIKPTASRPATTERRLATERFDVDLAPTAHRAASATSSRHALGAEGFSPLQAPIPWSTEGTGVREEEWYALFFPTAQGVNGLTLLLLDDGAGIRTPKALRVEYLDGGAWHPCRSVAQEPALPAGSPGGTPHEIRFAPVHTQGIRIAFEKGEASETGVGFSALHVWGSGEPTPYLNSLGVEISHLAWDDMLRRGRHPVAEVVYMFDWINKYFRDQGAGYTQFHLPVITRVPAERDPENPWDYFWAEHDWDRYNCFIFVSQGVGGYAAPNKGPRIGCTYDPEYESKPHQYVPWTGLQRRAMAHELCHFRGIQDFYTAAVDPAKNRVNGERYRPATADIPALMCTHYPEHPVLTDYCKEILWQKRHLTVPLSEHYIWKEVPRRNFVRVVDADGNPVSGAVVNVYKVDFWKDPQVAPPPLKSGTTGADGRMLFASRQGDGDLDITFMLLLFEVVRGEEKRYDWLELLPLNRACWRGEDEFTHTIRW